MGAYYDDGALRSVASYDAPHGWPGKMLNKVERYYNQFGMVTTEFQHHSEGEPSSLEPTRVNYGYDVGASSPQQPVVHAPRLTTIEYPHGGKFDGRERFALWHGYTQANYSDALNRCNFLAQGVPLPNVSDPVLSGAQSRPQHQLVRYRYFGLNSFYYHFGGPGLGWDVSGDPPSPPQPGSGLRYGALDRFDRFSHLTWWNTGNDLLEGVSYGYDRVGNRLMRENRPQLAGSRTPITKQHDELYHYDALYRLKDMGRGTLNNPHPTIPAARPTLASRTRTQVWLLDQQDNWRAFLEDENGDGRADLLQTRKHDRSNRIEAVTNHGRPAEHRQVKYDDVGNMTKFHRLPDFDKEVSCEYDGWNRLVRVKHGKLTVGEYEYDGLGRRIVKRTFTPSGQPDETRHFYYTHDWRLLEERVEESGKKPWQGRTDRRYVWGLHGLDDLVCRDRDTNGNGTLDERLAVLSDGNGNIVSLYHIPIPGSGGTSQGLVERFEYDPYGRAWFMTPTFAARSESDYDWNVLYGGYYYDAETGLYHVRNRMYHPLYGRWLQTDPLGFEGSYNLYQYCFGSPLSYVDPTGEFPWIPVLFFLAIASSPALIAPSSDSEIDAESSAAIYREHQERQVREFANWVSFAVPMGTTRTLLGRAGIGALTNVGIHGGEDLLTLAGTGDLKKYRDSSGEFRYDQFAASYAFSAAFGAALPFGVTAMGRGVGSLWRRARARFRFAPNSGLARTSDWTTSRGVIRISDAHSGSSWRPYVHNHESVHRFFTPGAGVPSTQLSKIARARQILRLRGYQNSSILRYTEEAIAESYALYRRTGNLSKAIGIGSRFPITRGYVTVPGLLLEGGIGGTICVGLLYGAYEFGEYLFDE